MSVSTSSTATAGQPDALRAHAARLAIAAELMLGNAQQADEAAAEALLAGLNDKAFSPLRAWRALLEIPGLAAGKMPPVGQALQPLQRLSPGQRLLLLLALLSGRSSIELAALLKISPAECQRALQRAQQQLTAAEFDSCQSALEMRQRGFSPARWAYIRRRLDGVPQSIRPAAKPPRRWGLLLVLLATALALMLTWFWPSQSDEEETIPEIPPTIQTQPLPEQPPARRDSDGSRVLVDRELLGIPAQDAPIASETAFFSWYQAERLGQAGGLPPDLPEEPPIELPPEPVDWLEEYSAEPTDD